MQAPLIDRRAAVKAESELRAWPRDEELANSLSHAIGFLGALVGTPFLLATAMHHGGVGRTLGAAIFGASCMFLYLCSALVHGLAPGKARDLFEVLDFSGIFLLIAGTYTPFALGVLWGPWGWLLLSVIWPLAIAGMLVKFIRGIQSPGLTIALYVGMGWFMLFVLKPLSMRVPIQCLALLFAGGFAYTGGLIFFFARKLRYHHLAWHVAVLAGTTCHFVAIWRYAI